MKRVLFLALFLSCAPIYAEPITPEVRIAVLAIAEELGVPRSVADQLHIEESGWWKTGRWGKADAVKVEDSGYTSEGLFQIHTKPDNLKFLLDNFYPHGAKYFDIRNPIDNARVALGYLAWLHRQYGSWYNAYIFYNHGSFVDIPQGTLDRARRIIEARWKP